MWVRTTWLGYLAALLVMGCSSGMCGSEDDCGPGWSCAAGVCEPVLGSGADARGGAPAPAERACARPRPGDLVLNEVLADPSGADINGDGVPDPFDDEFVEVLNTASRAVDLGGVALRVGSKIRYRFPVRCAQPGEVLVVFGGGAPPEGTLVADGLKLTNTGTTVALLDGDEGPILDLLQYGKEADGPNSLTRDPDGKGLWGLHPELPDMGAVAHSAGRCVNGAEFPACEATRPPDAVPEPDPEPCQPPVMGEVVLNEVLADPGGADANGDGMPVWQHDEFVEVLVTSPEARAMGGVSVLVNGSHRAKLPSGCYGAGSAFVIFGGGAPKLEVGPSTEVLLADKSLTLSNAGGVVSLTYEDEIVDLVAYGPEGGMDASMTRYPDGAGPFVLHDKTPSGAPFSPGRCVDGATFDEGLWESPRWTSDDG